MKILLLSAYFYPHRGGSEFFLENLHHRLYQSDKNWQTDVICCNTEKVAAFEEGYLKGAFNIYRLTCHEILTSQFAIPKYGVLKKLLKKLKDEGKKYDLVVSNTRFFDNSWRAKGVGEIFNAPTVLVDYCADHPSHENWLIRTFAAGADNLAAAWIRKRFDLMIATSQATKEFMSERLGLPVAKTVVYNGIDSEFFDQYRPRRQQGRVIPKSRWQPTKNDKVVTFVGRFINSKHPEIVLEVAKEMVAQAPELHFVLAGSGPLWTDLLAEVKKQPVQIKKRIHFLGRIDRAEIAQLLWASDILVHPSTHAEGMPTTLAEAGYCRTMVIASDRGDSKNVIRNGETGLIMEKVGVPELITDLNWVLAHHKEVAEMAKKLKLRVEEKFTLDVNVPKYKRLVERLVKKKGLSGDSPCEV